MATTGEVGLLQQIRCDWSFPLSRVYGAELGADPDAGTWAAILEYAACHAADVCRWCFGDVLTVSADIDPQPAAPLPGRRPDTDPLLAIFVLGQENGPATCHFARSRAVTPSERYTFTGSAGHLEVVISSSTNQPDAFPAMTVHRTGQRPHAVSVTDLEGCTVPAPAYRTQALLRDFIGRARSRTASAGAGEPARAALEVVHAAYQSAHDGRKVALPLRRSPTIPLR
jgi:predicted dehydrogenase